MTYTQAIEQIVKDLNSIYTTTEKMQKLSFEDWALVVLKNLIESEDKNLKKHKEGNKGKIPDAIRQMLVLDDVTPTRLYQDFRSEVSENGSDGFDITKD